MKEHINQYESIRETFVMDDRDQHEFKLKTFEADALPYALRRSFKDFNFRTLTAVKSDKTTGFVSAFDEWVAKQRAEGESAIGRTDYLIEQLRKAKFYERFVTYFKKSAPNNQDKFNGWHHETCELFLETLKDDYENLCYGKAQKIVNMMFKHLYCLNGAKEYDDKGYFKYCHLTLDSFTLEWFHRNIGEKVGVWSNLQYNEAKNKYENYEHYVEKITAHFIGHSKDYNDLTPFQYEFYMWPEMQLELAAEAFYFAWNDKLNNSERDKFKKETLGNKIGLIRQLLAE